MSGLLGPAVLVAALVPLLALPFLGEFAGEVGSLPGALLAALAASLVATALGGAAGLGLATRFPGRRAALAVIALPLLLPPVLPGAALLLVLEGAGIGGGLAAAALWHALLGASVVAALVRMAVERIDPALLRAAEACGAPPEVAARRLLQPRLRPALVLGAALSFGLSLGESTVAAILRADALPGAPLLPVLLAALALGIALLARAGAGTK